MGTCEAAFKISQVAKADGFANHGDRLRSRKQTLASREQPTFDDQRSYRAANTFANDRGEMGRGVM